MGSTSFAVKLIRSKFLKIGPNMLLYCIAGGSLAANSMILRIMFLKSGHFLDENGVKFLLTYIFYASYGNFERQNSKEREENVWVNSLMIWNSQRVLHCTLRYVSAILPYTLSLSKNFVRNVLQFD